MKLTKTLLVSVSALGLAVGSAFANDDASRATSGIDSRTSSANDLTLESGTGMSGQPNQPTQHPEDAGTFVASEPMELSYVEVYDVDGDRDGKVDGQLLLERSDTVILLTPTEPQDAPRPDLESPSGS
jgi:hypothetical protein